MSQTIEEFNNALIKFLRLENRMITDLTVRIGVGEVPKITTTEYLDGYSPTEKTFELIQTEQSNV